jgi:hypothetical protein
MDYGLYGSRSINKLAPARLGDSPSGSSRLVFDVKDGARDSQSAAADAGS